MCRYIVLLLISGILWAQTDFDLEDLNPNSETYGDTIGPADYLGDICIVLLISLILHPASTKCPQTKNPANVGLDG